MPAEFFGLNRGYLVRILRPLMVKKHWLLKIVLVRPRPISRTDSRCHRRICSIPQWPIEDALFITIVGRGLSWGSDLSVLAVKRGAFWQIFMFFRPFLYNTDSRSVQSSAILDDLSVRFHKILIDPRQCPVSALPAGKPIGFRLHSLTMDRDMY